MPKHERTLARNICILALVSVILCSIVATVSKGVFASSCEKKITRDFPGQSFEAHHEGWKKVYIHAGTVPPVEAETSSWKSRGQVQQDSVVRAMLPAGELGEQKRYFIDLAANDHIFLSNTYALETFENWDGLCIEPNSQYWTSHFKRRCTLVAAVIGESMQNGVFKLSGVRGGIVGEDMDNKETDFSDASSFKKFTSVDMQEVLRITNAPKTIDYFSLDVEGAESIVFDTIPFETHTIYVFTIERPAEQLRTRLAFLGYVEVGILGNFGDTMYLSKATPSFEKVLSRGQVAITKITKQLKHVTEQDIGPVIKIKKGDPEIDTDDFAYAKGVRCPHFHLKECAHLLKAWDDPYSLNGTQSTSM